MKRFTLHFFVLILLSSCAERECLCENLLYDRDGLARYGEPGSEEEEKLFSLYLEQQELERKLQLLVSEYELKLAKLKNEEPEPEKLSKNELISKIEKAENKKDTVSIIRYQEELADLYAERRDIVRGAELYMKNLDLLKNRISPDKRKMAETEFAIGRMYLTKRRYREYADDHINEGIRIANELKDTSVLLTGYALLIESTDRQRRLKSNDEFFTKSCKLINNNTDYKTLKEFLSAVAHRKHGKMICNEFYQILKNKVNDQEVADEISAYSDLAKLAYYRNETGDFQVILTKLEQVDDEKLSVKNRETLLENLRALYSLSGDREKRRNLYERKEKLNEAIKKEEARKADLRLNYELEQNQLGNERIRIRREIIRITSDLRKKHPGQKFTIENIQLFTGTCNDSLGQMKEYRDGVFIKNVTGKN